MDFNSFSEDRANKTERKLFSMKLPVFSMGKENVYTWTFRKIKTGQNILPSKDIHPV